MVMYIVYTEPVQNQEGNMRIGNEVAVFCRDFDERTGVGKSKYFTTEMQHVIPSFDLDGKKVDKILTERGKKLIGRADESIDEKVDRLIFLLSKDHPAVNFVKKDYSQDKRVIHAVFDDLRYKNSLPKYFLRQVMAIGKNGKPKATRVSFYSPTTYFRWRYAPPFTVVEEKNGQLIFPKKRKFVDKEIVLADKKCALDIETTEYDSPELERITNAVLNFGEKKYIITSFRGVGDRFRDYDVIYAENTDGIKNMVEGILHEEDPLIIYGFNIVFDQKKLRELGDDDYLPGVDFSRPVFKGLKNMMTKGRFTVDLYPFLSSNKNIYKNNTLATHSGIEKDMNHAVLEFETYQAEHGRMDSVQRCMGYVAGDGDITRKRGDENIENIVSRALFAKISLEKACTASSKANMGDYWNKKFYFEMNTYKNRYEHGYNRLEFDPENKKDELLNLERNKCLEDRVSLVYPKFFINSLWDMIRGTTSTLRFGTPLEKLNFCQTLHGYITHSLIEYFELKEEKPGFARVYAFEQMYGIKFDKIDSLLKKNVERMNELLKDAGLINYSKKFLYVKNPEQIEKEKLGFVFGTGPMLSAGEKIVSLIDGRLIYQGFGLTRGTKTSFDKEFAEAIIKKRLLLMPEEEVIEFVGSEISKLRNGDAPKEDLLFKKNVNGRRYDYGIVEGKEMHAMEFLTREVLPDFDFYIENFKRAFLSVIRVDFKDLKGLKDAFK